MTLYPLNIRFALHNLQFVNGSIPHTMDLEGYHVEAVVSAGLVHHNLPLDNNIHFSYDRNAQILSLGITRQRVEQLFGMEIYINLTIFSEKAQRDIRRKEFRENTLKNL